MKLLLIGYPGSQIIRPASEYLINKYMPGFYVTWLCYEGNINNWSSYIADYLSTLDDELVMMALDDYLINAPLKGFGLEMEDAVCCKLCFCTNEENNDYPVTTQYTIWKREYLIHLLTQTTNPWNFEIEGSRIFKQEGQKMIHQESISYDTHSSLSKRWEGVQLNGLLEEDIKKVQSLL